MINSPTRSSIFKNGLAFGHIIECFDNTLYGYYAVFLAPLFFPSDNFRIHAFAAFGSFAAGFLARPLGALFFGLIGDSKSRKRPLLYSLSLVGIPAIIIGLLPSYQSIGMVAPVLLISCRIIQGFLFGGEFAGVNLYIYENLDQKYWGTNTGILLSTGVLGAMFAALSGALVTSSIMPAWAWRVPFILGGIFALSTYFLRKKLDYQDFPKTQQYDLRSIFLILAGERRVHILIGILLSGLTVVPLYLATIYANKVFKELGFTHSESMLLNAAALLVDAALVALSGKLADKIGFDKTIKFAFLSNIILAFPAFYLLYAFPEQLLATLVFVFLIVASGCILNGCAMPYISGLYPKEIRYTGVAVSHSLGISLIGGTTPLMATFLSSWFQTNLAPSFLMIILSFVTFFFFRKISQKHS